MCPCCGRRPRDHLRLKSQGQRLGRSNDWKGSSSGSRKRIVSRAAMRKCHDSDAGRFGIYVEPARSGTPGADRAGPDTIVIEHTVTRFEWSRTAGTKTFDGAGDLFFPHPRYLDNSRTCRRNNSIPAEDKEG